MPSELDSAEVRRVTTTDEAGELMRWLGERRNDELLAFDTETTGLDKLRDTVRLVQFGDTRTGWAVPADDWRGLVKEVIRRGNEGRLEWCAWNAKYDQAMLERYCGVVPERVHDGSVMAHLRDPLALRALKDTAGRLVDPRAKTLDRRLEERMAEHRWTWATVPADFPPYWAYGALDCVLTANCIARLQPEVLAAGQRDLYELELAAQAVCRKMERKGIRIDTEYATRRMVELDEEIDVHKHWCKEEYGFELGQRAPVIGTLLNAGWEPLEYTKTGNPSLGQESLGYFDHPLARAYLRKELAQRLAHTYFGGMLREAVGDRVHADINPLQAKTGRMSIAKPSLQNLPRSAEVRDAFIPADGHKLVMADFAQIELRLLASFAREPAMQAFFNSGADMPNEVARAVFAIPADQPVPKLLRQRVKSTLYSLVYGAGPHKIALVIGLSDDEGQAFLDRLFGLYPRIPAFQRKVQEVATERITPEEKRPWVEGWGHRRYYARRANHAYKLVNYLIQGEAGIAFKRRMVACDLAGLGEYMVVPVHDELGFEVPDEDVDDVRAVIADVMPDRETYPVELAVEVAPPYERWGDKYREAA